MMCLATEPSFDIVAGGQAAVSSGDLFWLSLFPVLKNCLSCPMAQPLSC